MQFKHIPIAAALAEILVTVSVTCGATAQTANPNDLDLDKVSESEISIADISNPVSAGKTFAAATIMDSSVQKICAVIMDYAQYPQFMPNTDGTRIVSSSENGAVIEMTLGLPLGKIKKYRLNMETEVKPQSCLVAWRQIPWPELKPSETIADTTGYWMLTPYSRDRSKTLVTYHVFADPGPVPFGLGWIVHAMSKISLPRTLEALRERVVAR